MTPSNRLLVICGATATGKSAVAQWIAERTGAVIVSADSMLVYRGMDVGTAKPSAAERGRVRYFGLDCVEPAAPFSTGDWLGRVTADLATLPENVPVIVAGGTGLYIKAFFNGLDASPSDAALRARFCALYDAGGLPALAAELAARGVEVPPGDRANPRRLIRALERDEAARLAHLAPRPDPRPPSVSLSPRPDPRSPSVSLSPRPDPRPPCRGGSPRACPGGRGGAPLTAPSPSLPPATSVLRPPLSAPPRICCLTMARDLLAERIRRRIEKMFADGLVEEALRCFGGALPADGAPTASGAIGYAEALAYHRGELGLDEAVARIAARTRQLAKRQETWFRHQIDAEWIEVAPQDTAETIAGKV